MCLFKQGHALLLPFSLQLSTPTSLHPYHPPQTQFSFTNYAILLFLILDSASCSPGWLQCCCAVRDGLERLVIQLLLSRVLELQVCARHSTWVIQGWGLNPGFCERWASAPLTELHPQPYSLIITEESHVFCEAVHRAPGGNALAEGKLQFTGIPVEMVCLLPSCSPCGPLTHWRH